jgi:hypothetical protein
MGVDQTWTKPGAEQGGSVPSDRGRRSTARSFPNRDRIGRVPLAPPRVVLPATAGHETLRRTEQTWGEMLAQFRALLRRVRAWQRRRGQLRGDPLLPPDAERARARATLDYYSRVGDPASW